MTWPDEAKAELKQLWPHGQSASVCARKLNEKFNMSLTRNAIIGMVNRLGMTGAHKNPREDSTRRVAEAKRRVAIKHTRTIIAGNGTVFRAGPSLLAGLRDLPPDSSPCAVTLMALNAEHCRWPVDDRLFCGDTKLDGCAYCERHAARAFRRGGE